MKKEIELRVYDINKEDLIKKIEELMVSLLIIMIK